MSYQKPTIIAINKPTGSYAAGCPAKNNGGDFDCNRCDRAK
ncbi:MAG: hypothetical protein QG599_734 [Pseudomonadota bacterium]|nr:hypothetical protein [Pseudomonadota bacterium]